MSIFFFGLGALQIFANHFGARTIRNDFRKLFDSMLSQPQSSPDATAKLETSKK